MARQTQGVAVVTDHHIDPERAQFDAFKALPRDTVIHMLNLVRFRDTAAYPADHPLARQDLSGADAYANYGRDSGPVFQRLRSEEHTSELQSLMRISYAVFCLKKQNTK